MTRALVTGATAGIGLTFARHLARDGHDLVLVARDAVRLGQVAAELRAAHGVEVEVLAADLVQRPQLERVAERLRADRRPVDLLVNNAGFGVNQRFVGGDLEAEERMLAVLCTAVLVLSHAAAGGMVRRGHGAIVTVSSMASFFSLGTYSAAKAWATVFSEGLAGELRGSGVVVTALCPGYVHTEFHARAGIPESSIPGWLWLDADAVVATGLRDVRRGRAVSVPDVRYRVGAALAGVLPRPVVRAVSGRMSERRHRAT